MLVIVGIGNVYRSDDGLGIRIMEMLREDSAFDTDCSSVELLVSDGDLTNLFSTFALCDELILVDAVASDASLRSGEVVEIHSVDELQAAPYRSSSHVMGLAESLQLARVLGCLPERLTIYGIVGENFSIGQSLSAAVRTAVDQMVTRLSRTYGDLTCV